MANLPPPFEFGVDDKYTDWRPRQDEVVERIVDSNHRLIMPVCPTGFGKSLTYVVAGLSNGGKTVILTSTKALQDQLARDYEGLVADIRGKNNYPCTMMGGMTTADMGPCNWGFRCPFIKSGCSYYDQLKRAMQAPIISTNYAYWLNRRDWGGVGDSEGLVVDTLVCDEAHELPEIISNYLTKEIIWTKHIQLFDQGNYMDQIRSIWGEE
jgi:Rad3-related DNA helicase